MRYCAFLSSILISLSFGAGVLSSNGDIQIRNSSNTPTLEDRLRVLEEALSANNVSDDNSVEGRLIHVEQAFAVAYNRVIQLEARLRRANTAFAKQSFSEDKTEKVETQSNGVSFIRWGRTLCNDSDEDATTVYSGYMAGTAYNKDGGGANFLCLHEHPQWGYRKNGFQKQAGIIYGTESKNYDQAEYIDPFSTKNSGGGSVVNKPLPCAACFVPQRSTWMMIPARRECPDGWTLEYRGYIHSQGTALGYQKTTFECIDEAPEVAVGATAQSQAFIYAVQVGCGSLPCSIFTDGWELTCVVCTR